MTLRTRCLVLRQIEHFQGKATLDLIHTALPDLTRDAVQKSIYNLLQQDRIQKGEGKVIGKSGRPQFYYLVNAEWGSAKAVATKSAGNDGFKKPAKRLQAVGRKDHQGAMQTNTTVHLGTVRFRDRKIKLLLKLIDKVNGTDRDLLIGLLADLGHRYTDAA